MEVTRLNIISDFVAPLPKVPQVYNSFFKWGALILALLATFTSIITRIKLVIIRLRSIKHSSSSKHLLQPLDDDDFDFTDDDDSSSSDSESDNKEIFDSATSSFNAQSHNQFDEDFRVAGSKYKRSNSNLRRCRDLFLWSDFAAGKNVVKMWDSLGLRLDFQDSFGSELSIWDLDKDQKVDTFFGGYRQMPAVAMSSPAVVYLAETSNSDRVVFGGYDRRIGTKSPAVYAEWGPRRGKVVGVSSGGVEKVYVKGGGESAGVLMVGDLRNVRAPLADLTESDAESWWDADAVINQEEF